jgi:hypothetical protein
MALILVTIIHDTNHLKNTRASQSLLDCKLFTLGRSVGKRNENKEEDCCAMLSLRGSL